jgi:hypothetical protein
MSSKDFKKILRRTKPEKVNKAFRFGVCDIEVDKWVNFICIGYYDGLSKVFKWFDNMDDFLDFIFDHCDKNDIPSIFAHFGGKFDFNFILRDALSGKKYQVHSLIPRSSSILCFDMLKVDKNKPITEWKKISFRDSSALLPNALRTLTETFDVEVKKGHIDYEKIGELWKTKKGQKEVIDYLQDDCVSLWQVLFKFYSQDLIVRAGPAFTTASQALKVYQTFMPEGLAIMSLPRQIDHFVRSAYFGGRTEVFKPVFDSGYDIKKNPLKFSKKALEELKKQKKAGKLYYVDVNSLFPHCMKENDFPSRFLFKTDDAKDYDPKGIGFWEVTVKVPKKLFCPPLGKKHIVNGGEKLIFPTGTFKGRWSIAEIEYSKTLGVEVLKYHMGVVFDNAGKIFEEYIETLYKMRLEARSRGDDATATLVKLMMNSTYGKFGQSFENKEQIVIDQGQSNIKPHSEVETKQGKVRFGLQKKDNKHGFSNVAIAAYVTAYSRILMHKLYMEAGEDHLYYTDTDSLFTSKLFNTGDKLGQLKLEYTCKSACFLLPKTYVNEGIEGEKFVKKLTMKGFDKKKITHFSFEDFKECLYGDMKRLKVIQSPKFATLKTALQKGEFVCMAFDPETEEVVTRKRLESTKGKIRQITDAMKLMGDKPEYKEMVISLKQRKLRAQSKLRTLEKKLNSGFESSTRSIKSKYDKRICSADGFFSKPIDIQEQ